MKQLVQPLPACSNSSEPSTSVLSLRVSHTLRGKQKQKRRALRREVSGYLERSPQNTNSDRPDGPKGTPHPSPDLASLRPQGAGEGVFEILNLVPAARNLVKVNKVSDSSSKSVLSIYQGSGAELGSTPYPLGTRGSHLKYLWLPF